MDIDRKELCKNMKLQPSNLMDGLLFEISDDYYYPLYNKDIFFGLRADEITLNDLLEKLKTTKYLDGEIENLLEPYNWRFTAPALVAILCVPDKERHVRRLWEILIIGSDAGRQIVALLSIIDPCFEKHADFICKKYFEADGPEEKKGVAHTESIILLLTLMDMEKALSIKGEHNTDAEKAKATIDNWAKQALLIIDKIANE